MSQGLVLVIDDDEWVGRLLAVALRESGYEVLICASAVEGYEKAVEVQPDCIICDVDLPDVDGFWVARKIRMASSNVSVTPFLFLSGLDDRDTRIQGFHVGADVYMTKPFRIDEVVAQVGALVQMVTRLRQSRKSFLSVPPTDAAMVGDLAQMSIATVLTLLDMERRSGKLDVSSKDQKATLVIVSGAITSAAQGGDRRDPLELLRVLLTWKSGRFAFRPDEAEVAETQDNSINALLMEAVRLEDETRASLVDPAELGPAAGKSWMPVISSPPASDPMDSARISAALQGTFNSSAPPQDAGVKPAVPPAITPPAITPPAITPPPPAIAVKEKAPAQASAPPTIATPAPPPVAATPAPPAAAPRGAPLGGMGVKKPMTPLPAAPRSPSTEPKTSTSTAGMEAVKPLPPVPARAPKPPASPLAKPPLPTLSAPPPAEEEEDSGWSEPPPMLDPESDAAEPASPEKLRPPPAPTGLSGTPARPAAPRASPARAPLPNPRVGQGSGDK